MRLRDPKDKIAQLKPQFSLEQTLQDLDQQAAKQEEKKWHKYKIEVITPIFGGGVKAGEPDTKMPIRASAIRGQLRYWWRFLESANRDLTDREEQKRLFRDERDIWGGMAEEGEDHSSKVRIKICDIQNKNIKYYDEKEAGYALFPARKEADEDHPKKLIRERMTFNLQLRILDNNKRKEIKCALRWWVTFGGIGARTRRGCGSVYCTNELGNLPPVTRKEAKAVGCELVFPKGETPRNPIPSWKRAIDILYKFRQAPNIARNHGRNNRFGRSKWPEPDSIRKITNSYFKGYHKGRPFTHKPTHKAMPAFPRAAFGLPIEFKFSPKDTQSRDEKKNDPETTHLVPADPNLERLASPLILTAYPVRENGITRYVPAALLMKNQDHIKAMTLALKKGEIYISGPPAKWSKNWWKASKATLVDPIRDNDGTDALTAFMNFFARGGA
uniref:type III-B CRISPR module RAMP protein Cmr1 n=1 Tax=Candidatus Electrothrix sp. TaxID=2170559 RepID=UPI004056749D